ncbi:MAG: hypothetical protein COA78_20140 [Blastopirellula sp.]|nr:MAG: hypothetical protein COA78_20140 [Blastopirellula sp.]
MKNKSLKIASSRIVVANRFGIVKALANRFFSHGPLESTNFCGILSQESRFHVCEVRKIQIS